MHFLSYLKQSKTGILVPFHMISATLRPSVTLNIGFVVENLNCLLSIILGLRNYKCIIQGYVLAVALLTAIFIAETLSTLIYACVAKSKLPLFLFCTARFTMLLVISCFQNYPVHQTVHYRLFLDEHLNSAEVNKTIFRLRVQMYNEVTKRFDVCVTSGICLPLHASAGRDD